MFDALETGFGLDLILWLQNLRLPFIEVLVKILDFMGEELLYIAIIALIYWVFNKGLGMRLVFILLLASLVTAGAKDLFATERPYEVSALVNELVQEANYGVPSGHVLTSLAVWGYLAYALKRRWVWAVVLLYVVLQSLGRMLAGVHYPQDVLLGWLLGGGILALYIALAEKFAAFWNKAQSGIRLGLIAAMLVAIFGFVYLISFKSPLVITLSAPCPVGTELIAAACSKPVHIDSYFTSIGLFLGASLAVWLEASRVQFKPHSQAWRRILQYLLGIILAVALLLILGRVVNAISETGLSAYLLRALRYSSVVFVALGVWPWLSIKMGLMEKR